MRCVSRWGWIARDKVPVIDRLREGPGRIIALSDEQCASLLEGALVDQDTDLWLFVLICLQTSMRHGEARRLRWEHYDAHRRRFYIPEAKAGERDQPIPSSLAAALERTMQERGATKGYVFLGGPGSSTGYRHTFRKAFQRAVKRAGLDVAKVTPHTMRHTAITKLVKAGVDLPTVQRVSGHKTLSMVLRYTHVDGAHIDGAIEHLGIASAKTG
ncbi:tyrosine-type recombinase/integrase [Sphingomonas sp. LB3N6]|uniref:tyrosine-type recombinase/integrase n=1 Tax=Sphingomonas fucosidasi TaxID=3096164 RepID=UPI003FA77665